MKYKHLTVEERYHIAAYKKAGYRQKDMAKGEAFFNQEGDFVTLAKTFNLQVEELEFEDDNATALDYYYLMVAQDINGNMAFSALQKAQKDSN